MPVELTPETWVQIRDAYENSDTPVEDICIEHGVSPGTLRDRMRRWKWTRRRPTISAEGPPPVETAPWLIASPDAAHAPDAVDPSAIVKRLQSAVARVLPAIEATLAKLGTGSTSPQELEHASRALSSLTRTLHELNTLLSRFSANNAKDDEMPEDIDAFRIDLARRIDALVASRSGETAGGANDASAIPAEIDSR